MILNSRGEARQNVRKQLISSAHTTAYCYHNLILVANVESQMCLDDMSQLLRLCWWQHKSSQSTISHCPFHPSSGWGVLKFARSAILKCWVINPLDDICLLIINHICCVLAIFKEMRTEVQLMPSVNPGGFLRAIVVPLGGPDVGCRTQHQQRR